MAAAQDIRLITSESVTEGHPDKVCDQISDAILDELLKKDSSSHVAVETCATTGQFLVFGEITSEGYVNINQIVRETLERIGYTSSDIGLDAGSAGVLVSINEQSPEINAGVSRQAATQEERYAVQGAGDQGIMFGYACDETDAFMPLPIELAHRLAERLAYVRKKGIVAHLRPDGKTQVTVEYDGSGVPRRVDTIVISAQHDPEVSQGWLRDELIRNVIRPVLDSTLASCRGGAFSGKDPSKVDRSAAYAARWIAKNIVAAGLAHKAEVQLAYAIGVAEPVSVTVDTMGTGTEPGITDPVLAQAVRQVFDLRPAAVIDELDLLRPIYSKTAPYGHFGRADEGFTWEQIDKAGELREAALSAARQQ